MGQNTGQAPTDITQHLPQAIWHLPIGHGEHGFELAARCPHRRLGAKGTVLDPPLQRAQPSRIDQQLPLGLKHVAGAADLSLRPARQLRQFVPRRGDGRAQPLHLALPIGRQRRRPRARYLRHRHGPTAAHTWGHALATEDGHRRPMAQ